MDDPAKLTAHLDQAEAHLRDRKKEMTKIETEFYNALRYLKSDYKMPEEQYQQTYDSLIVPFQRCLELAKDVTDAQFLIGLLSQSHPEVLAEMEERVRNRGKS